ncbi:hypothetical protein KRR26_02230 [Corallococcus sp. M34]|uniref:hypothetical protein n=1 Tax=Citreicoccus inhibens TaxID=2849499 RepID=UPI001C2385EE|nr:hypothetical protein [Citreicoccus inhibens]MBU8894401.1 hypothetical protein [Citreicoccus inhibens]
MSNPFRRLVVLTAMLVTGMGCGGGPYYRLDWSLPDTVTLVPGESATIPVTVRRVASVQGETHITLQNAPDGVTLAPDVTIPEGQDSVSATPTLSVATGTGVSLQSVSQMLLVAEDPANDFASGSRIYLSVLAPPAPQPEFSVSVEPRQVDFSPGQRKEVTLTVTRAEGFTGPLTVSLDTPVKRITVDPLTFSPDQTTATVSVRVEAGVSPIPVPARLVVTSEAGAKASTGMTFNVRQVN